MRNPNRTDAAVLSLTMNQVNRSSSPPLCSPLLPSCPPPLDLSLNAIIRDRGLPLTLAPPNQSRPKIDAGRSVIAPQLSG
uniref:Uncharacterized protein n=1 Tax=Knipowitschia caucasica TaxID=637954 RepID=A0AAV2JQB9_KNICA